MKTQSFGMLGALLLASAFAAAAEPAANTPAAPAPAAAETTTPSAAAAEPAAPSADAEPAAPSEAAPTSETTASAEIKPDLAAELEEESPGVADSMLSGESLKLYGFGDVGYRHLLVPDNSPWLVYLNRHPSMFVGHLNFYFDAQLAAKWRALAEVRFTYMPQGGWRTGDDGVVTHNDTRQADYMDFTREHPVNGLMIERAFIEYEALSFLSLQAGQFLTPYGIWNVDHGSPVIIGVSPPFIVGARLLPDSQVGLLGYGRVNLVDNLELGYALGVSNGRTDLIAYEDLDDNKALTARLALTYRGLGELTLGSTFYTGTATDNTRGVYFEDGSPKSSEDITYQVKERNYAFDLRWTYHDLNVQAEAIIAERKFTDAGRPTFGSGLEPDRRYMGGYGLVGYRTPLAGLMPYVKGEYSPDPALQGVGVDQNVTLLTGGLNFRPVPRVVLKGEYTYGFWFDPKPNTFAENPISAIDFQIAWAF
ncbi:MAG TPA: hypothetical protein VIW29_10385 [Polyangiaceae bacterium]